MIGWALMRLLEEVIFNSVVSRRRAYEAEIDRYFEERQFYLGRTRGRLTAR